MERDPRPGEDDVERDDAEALSRATGGVPDDDAPDQHSSTGTTPNDEMVGRVSGQDVGYAGRPAPSGERPGRPSSRAADRQPRMGSMTRASTSSSSSRVSRDAAWSRRVGPPGE